MGSKWIKIDRIKARGPINDLSRIPTVNSQYLLSVPHTFTPQCSVPSSRIWTTINWSIALPITALIWPSHTVAQLPPAPSASPSASSCPTHFAALSGPTVWWSRWHRQHCSPVNGRFQRCIHTYPIVRFFLSIPSWKMEVIYTYDSNHSCIVKNWELWPLSVG